MHSPSTTDTQDYTRLTVEIVAAYVGRNQVPAKALSPLIHDIYAALKDTEAMK